MTPAERASTAEQVHQALVELKMYRYPGAAGLVRRWFIVDSDHPFRTEAEALQAAAHQHERRGQP
jgi:hypothetical protein